MLAALAGAPTVAVAQSTPFASVAARAARFTGEVTDALRTPTHRLAASAGSGRAVANLVFVDARHAHTTVRACVLRRDVARVRTCFNFKTAAAGVATVTPLHFPVGRYGARWWVAGVPVASWRFVVV